MVLDEKVLDKRSGVLYIFMNCHFCHCIKVSVQFMFSSWNLETYFGSFKYWQTELILCTLIQYTFAQIFILNNVGSVFNFFMYNIQIKLLFFIFRIFSVSREIYIIIFIITTNTIVCCFYYQIQLFFPFQCFWLVWLLLD